jgi:hypothetical protein
MGWLLAYLPIPELMTVKTAIWRLAQANKNTANAAARAEADAHAASSTEAGESRAVGESGTAGEAGDGGAAADPAAGPAGEAGFVPIDAYRADALVELAARYLTDTDPRGVLNRQAPAIRVTVSMQALLGDSDEPADLAGYGPIPASLARQIAADPDGTWQRIVTDPLGRLIDLGRTRYRPPKPLADHVRVRDQTCAFPTCNRQAENCDLDHVCDWAHGGHTCPDNLVRLCSRHHHLKHNGNWTITYNPTTGTTQWTTPTGRHYTNHPPELPGTG